jgi:flagellar motor switch protein FliN/FliY
VVDAIFSPLSIDAIGEIMNISLGSSATAISMMLDHRVDITTPKVEVIDVEKFSLGRIDPAVGVEIKYISGLQGSNIMLLKRGDVKAIVDILLGSETTDEEFELNELSISVVCEVMNQMMGAASTALSDLLGRMVNISTPESFEMDDLEKVKREHFPVYKGPVVVVSFNLSIEGVLQSEFMNVMSMDLAQELISGFGVEEAPAAAAVTQPAPVSAPSSASGGRSGSLSQEEIEQLMAGTGSVSPPVPSSGGGSLSQGQIEQMMADMTRAPAPAPSTQSVQIPAAQQPAELPSYYAGGYPAYPGYPPAAGGYPYPPYPIYPPQPFAEPKVIQTQAVKMPELEDEARLPKEQKQNLDLIMSVSLEVAVEIGRTKRRIQDILAFSKGSLVVLDKLAGDQVDLLVNGQCIARGDVVVIDDNFGIRITEILQKLDLNELN